MANSWKTRSGSSELSTLTALVLTLVVVPLALLGVAALASYAAARRASHIDPVEAVRIE